MATLPITEGGRSYIIPGYGTLLTNNSAFPIDYEGQTVAASGGTIALNGDRNVTINTPGTMSVSLTYTADPTPTPGGGGGGTGGVVVGDYDPATAYPVGGLALAADGTFYYNKVGSTGVAPVEGATWGVLSYSKAKADALLAGKPDSTAVYTKTQTDAGFTKKGALPKILAMTTAERQAYMGEAGTTIFDTTTGQFFKTDGVVLGGNLNAVDPANPNETSPFSVEELAASGFACNRARNLVQMLRNERDGGGATTVKGPLTVGDSMPGTSDGVSTTLSYYRAGALRQSIYGGAATNTWAGSLASHGSTPTSNVVPYAALSGDATGVDFGKYPQRSLLMNYASANGYHTLNVWSGRNDPSKVNNPDLTYLHAFLAAHTARMCGVDVRWVTPAIAVFADTGLNKDADGGIFKVSRAIVRAVNECGQSWLDLTGITQWIFDSIGAAIRKLYIPGDDTHGATFMHSMLAALDIQWSQMAMDIPSDLTGYNPSGRLVAFNVWDAITGGSVSSTTNRTAGAVTARELQKNIVGSPTVYRLQAGDEVRFPMLMGAKGLIMQSYGGSGANGSGGNAADFVVKVGSTTVGTYGFYGQPNNIEVSQTVVFDASNANQNLVPGDLRVQSATTPTTPGTAQRQIDFLGPTLFGPLPVECHGLWPDAVVVLGTWTITTTASTFTATSGCTYKAYTSANVNDKIRVYWFGNSLHGVANQTASNTGNLLSWETFRLDTGASEGTGSVSCYKAVAQGQPTAFARDLSMRWHYTDFVMAAGTQAGFGGLVATSNEVLPNERVVHVQIAEAMPLAFNWRNAQIEKVVSGTDVDLRWSPGATAGLATPTINLTIQPTGTPPGSPTVPQTGVLRLRLRNR